MEGMRRLQDAGVVAEVGVSNFDLRSWREAEHRLGRRVLSNQVRYNLVNRDPERGLLGFAEASGLVIAYSPLAQGLLPARYDANNLPSGGVRQTNPLFLPENLERAQPLLDTLREVAAGHEATPAQVSLAWLPPSDRRGDPRASSIAQLESNMAAAELELADDETTALTAASDAFTPVSGPNVARSMAARLLGRLRR